MLVGFYHEKIPAMIYPKKIIDEVRDHLVRNHQTIAVAESVTAGHLQAALSTANDAALFFQGGITAYNLGQKCRRLSIEPIHAEACDCVSEKISGDMALSICRLFTSDYGIGITGYATPAPEKSINELFAWLAVAHHDRIIFSKKIEPGDNTAFDAQVMYTRRVLEELVNVVSGVEVAP
jgi:nicotinamide-nucleotide amidase